MNIEQMCCFTGSSFSSGFSLSLFHVSIHLFLTSTLPVCIQQHKCSVWIWYSATDGRGQKYWKGSNIWLLMTNTASLQFKFQIDPWERSLLRERNTPAGPGAAHLLIYVKRNPFLQIYHKGAATFWSRCLPVRRASWPGDVAGEWRGEKRKHKKKEKNNTLSNSIFSWPSASGTEVCVQQCCHDHYGTHLEGRLSGHGWRARLSLIHLN